MPAARPQRPGPISSLSPLRYLALLAPLLLAACASTAPSSPQLQPSQLIVRDAKPRPVTAASKEDADALDALLAYYSTGTQPQRQGKLGYSRSQDPSEGVNAEGIPLEGDLVSAAMTHLGVRYKWGGDNPDIGFDCSGLVVYAAQQSLGLKLPRSSSELAHEGESVSRNDLQPGDLVFFNTLGRRFSHVGIYLGDNQFIHAPNSRGVVRIESMDIRYWSKRYNGARRLAAN